MKNKKIIIRSSIVVLIVALIIIGIIFEINHNKKMKIDTNEIVSTINDEVNEELKDVVGFTYDEEYLDESINFYAIKETGELFKIYKFNAEENNFWGLNILYYYKGKLFFADRTDWYYIDLTKGNGNYEAQFFEDVQGVISDLVTFDNDRIYYVNYFGSFHYYDLNNNEFKAVTGSDYDIDTCDIKDNYVLDEENQKIYIEVDDTFVNKSCKEGNTFAYDIKTDSYELLNESFENYSKKEKDNNCTDLGKESYVCNKYSSEDGEVFEIVNNNKKYNLEKLFDKEYEIYQIKMALPNNKIIVSLGNSLFDFNYYMIDLNKLEASEIEFVYNDVIYVK